MEIDVLKTNIADAIWRAALDDAYHIGSAAQSWAEVSLLEEELAKAIPASKSEGRMARRGAVRAALRAGDRVRAETLVASYLGEATAPKSLKTALPKLLQSHTREGRSQGKPRLTRASHSPILLK